MALTNNRILNEVQGLKFTGVVTPGDDVLIGGVTSVEDTQDFEEKAASSGDGMGGSSDIDQSAQRVDVSVATEDALKGIPLMINALASMEYFGKESGASTYQKMTILKPRFHSLGFSAARSQHATINLQATCQFGDAADEFEDVVTPLAAQPTPTLTDPGRVWRMKNLRFGSLTPQHLQSIGFNLRRQVDVDWNDDDLGITAVDVTGGVIDVDVFIRDSKIQTGPPTHDIAAAIIKAGTDDLLVDLEGVGNQADATLTIRNVKFASRRKASQRGYSGWRVSGTALWQDPLTPFTQRTLDHATPADRMINFA